MKAFFRFVFLTLPWTPLLTMTAENLKVGMIGLDTSHVIAFTQLLNNPKHADHVAGARVVAGFKGGSPDVVSSRTRVDKFTRQLQDDFGVTVYPTIESMCDQVDVVMLMSVDGRPHLKQAIPVLEKGKPMFIDKPVAGSLRDALEIFRLAGEKNVPVFSSSSYRFYDSMLTLKAKPVGTIRSAISYGPCSLEPHHPDLFWYGVHPTEALFTIMGIGCQTVTRVTTESTDVVTGIWNDGRVGVFHGLRNSRRTPHQVTVFGSDDFAVQEGKGGYANLVKEIVSFFKTGVAPVLPDETIEIFAFMEAADESKRLGGIPVSIADVIEKNRQ